MASTTFYDLVEYDFLDDEYMYSLANDVLNDKIQNQDNGAFVAFLLIESRYIKVVERLVRENRVDVDGVSPWYDGRPNLTTLQNYLSDGYLMFESNESNADEIFMVKTLMRLGANPVANGIENYFLTSDYWRPWYAWYQVFVELLRPLTLTQLPKELIRKLAEFIVPVNDDGDDGGATA